MSEAGELLDLLWGDGAHSICYQRRPAPFNVLGFASDAPDLIAKSMRLSEQGCDTWFGVNALRRVPTSGRGRSEDVELVVALYADVDWADDAHKDAALPTREEVIERMAHFPIQPTATVASGHGLQCYWSLRIAIPASMALTMQMNLHALLQAHGVKPERFDLASVLRLPGTVNYKREPITVELAGIEPRARFEPYALAEQLAPIPERAGIPLAILRPDEGDQEMTPIEWLMEHADIRYEMERHGWQLHSTPTFEGYPSEFWTRPGKPISEGYSARLFASEVLFVFTANAEPLRQWQRYDVAEMIAAYDFGGSKGDLASHVRRTMMPKPPPRPLYAVPAGETAPVAPRVRMDVPKLPAGLWASSDALGRIAQAADASTTSREAMLLCACVIATLHIPPVVTIAGPPRVVAPHLFTCLVGEPGTGKGSVMDAAMAVFPAPGSTVTHTLSTAEGLLKSFYERDPNHEGKGPAPMVQHHHPVLVRGDEIGNFLATAGSRSERGESLLAEVKQQWMGERSGKGYATDEKRLVLAPLTYRMGAMLGIAPAKAEPLFGDQGGGFPERLTFAPAAVPDLDDEVEPPAHPGPLDWRNPWREVHYGIAPHIEVEPGLIPVMRKLNNANRRGEGDDPLDVHAVLMQLKLAIALACLDGRRKVEWFDWHRATDMMAMSKATRLQLQRVIEGGHQFAQVKSAGRAAHIAAHVETAKLGVRHEHDAARHGKLVIEVAERIYRKVREGGDTRRKTVRNKLSAAQRQVFEEALDYAKQEDWVIEIESDGQGQVKRDLQLGNAHPSR